MKKFFKILGIFFVLILIALVAIPYFYKEEIEQYIKDDINKNLNAVVDYKDVSISLLKDFPNLKVGLDQLTIDGIADFEGVRLLEMGHLDFSLNAKKVFLDKEFEIKKIVVSDLDVNMLVNKEGKSNFDIVKESTVSAETPTEKTVFELQLKQYQINNANIKFHDLTSGMLLELKGMNHKGSGKITDKAYLLSTDTSIEETSFTYDTQFLNKAKMQLDSDILIEEDYMKYSFTNPKLKVNNLDVAFQKSMIWLKEDDIDIDIAFATKGALKQMLSLVPKEYLEMIADVDANGSAVFNGFVKGVLNDTSYPAYTFNLDVKKGSIKHPELPESVTDINVAAKVSFAGGNNLDNTTIDLSNMHMLIANNAVDGMLKVSHPMTDPLLQTAFKSNLDLAKVKQAVPLAGIEKLKGLLDADFKLKGRLSAIEEQKYDDFEASGYFNLKNMQYKSDSIPYTFEIADAKLDVTPQALDMKNMDAKIGDNDFHVKGKISNYIAYFLNKDEVLKADFTMHSNYLNLNDFMDDEASEVARDTSSVGGVIRIPANILVNFTVDATKLQYQDMLLTDAEGILNVKDEKASLSAVLMKTLDGQMKLNGYYDSSTEKPISSFDIKMQKMSIVESATTLTTFSTYAPILQKVQGSFFSDLKMDVSLDENMSPIMNTVSAQGTFDTSNVNIKGIDVVKKIANIMKIDALSNPKIDNFKARFTIDKGVMKLKPVDFKLNNIQSGLSGSVNLNRQINFVFNMDVPREMLGSNPNALLEGIVGKLSDLGLKTALGDIIKMKFKITGDYNNPKIVPMIAGYEGNSTQEIVTEIITDKIEEVVDDSVEKARIEAQKQADKLMAQAREQADALVVEAEKLGEKLRKEAKKQGESLVIKAKNPIQKMLAQTAAEKLNTEADKKAKRLVIEARTKGDKLVQSAQIKADKLVQTAVKVPKK